ncbi:OLC1v1024222C1 [Oldenlandia corymbosa var. corymbosa]|uniref:OLC1v1024222C1 n=1 Tax=Oldenlandia corymbosa var. corymbosa TaxID=529605 RepID=A0AAV1C2J5_OLDCO|nr:OLC1v1024222C1 [Oldenlandia corymbosa var. corymbosa]
MSTPHPIHQANENSPYGDLTREEFYKKHQIIHKQSFMINNKNMKIYTQSWQPADYSPSKLKGLVAMVHGYCSESSWLFELNAVAVAKFGYFVCALDLQGHGYSQGSPGLISDFRSLVSDAIQFFDSKREEYPKLPAFLYGESMGGAICIMICVRQKNEWSGLILSGPMCGVSKKMLPVWPLEKLLPIAAFIAPSWRVSCTKPPTRGSYKEGWKKKLVGKSPNRVANRKPPAITAQELMKACRYIQRKCHELEVPLLILHGGDDTVCDPEAAMNVFEAVGSKDKCMKVFPGMWHQLIGEPNESVDLVFGIMISWIEVRAACKMVKIMN